MESTIDPTPVQVEELNKKAALAAPALNHLQAWNLSTEDVHLQRFTTSPWNFSKRRTTELKVAAYGMRRGNY